MSGETVLGLDDLFAGYRMGPRWVDAVRGVSLEIGRGETFGLVGESGCGKSTLAYAIMGHLGSNGRISGGRITFRGENLVGKSRRQMQELRGARISMVYQDPLASLNPALRIGRQVAEILQRHEGASQEEAWRRAVEMLGRVQLGDPKAIMRRYPHQLSGGQQQRVLIAMALITNPDLVIMDEPTTGLDVTTQATVLDLVNELKRQYDSAILYISHDLGVIARVCDQVGVMYAGELVERGTAQEIFHRPRHPYTVDLLACLPRLGRRYRAGRSLRSIPGRVPHPSAVPPACVYEPRCEFARDRCRQERPELYPDGPGHLARCFFHDEVARSHLAQRATATEGQGPAPAEQAPGGEKAPLLSVEGLRKYFGRRRRRYGLFGPRRRRTKAVDGVHFRVAAGETFSLVGESGCGKTTLGRTVVGLLEPTEGRIRVRGRDASVRAGKRPAELRRAIQIVFQSPSSSLNPRHRVGRIIGRPLALFGLKDRKQRRRRVTELLEEVRLDETYLDRYPGQLSGGEQQRVAIARAFAGHPDLVVMDEPVSSLDVSVQASILNLLVGLKEEEGSSYLFISHDLSVVQYLSDRIGVMYLGRLMEEGPVERIFTPPFHPYTEALLSAVEDPDPGATREVIRLEGPVPSPANPPSGCPFHTRCPRKYGPICEQELPPWQETAEGHRIRCHIPLEELRRAQETGLLPQPRRG